MPTKGTKHFPTDSKFSYLQIKFIYSEKASKFCKIFTLLLTTVHTVKSKVEILKIFVAFSECMNFNFLEYCQQSHLKDRGLAGCTLLIGAESRGNIIFHPPSLLSMLRL